MQPGKSKYKYMDYCRVVCRYVWEIETFDPNQWNGINYTKVSIAKELHRRYTWSERDWITGTGYKRREQDEFNKKWGKTIAKKKTRNRV